MAGHYELSVVSISDLTPNMRRVELQGAELANFPDDQESGYVKLLLAGGADDRNAKPQQRSYTIRRFDPLERKLTLDYACHEDASGPAAAWFTGVQIGDQVSVRGPGEKKLADPTADWFLLAGDMSALPALSVNLESLPADARGYVFIEVLSAQDRQQLNHPPGIDLQWIVNPNPFEPNVPLVDAILSAQWLSGTPYPWFAGEFAAMKRVRRYFRDERGIDRKAMYVSCYWKLGDSDEAMKAAKRADPEA